VRFRVDLAASVPKDVTCPTLNEDAWAHNEEFTCVALSDGASESFDSRTWANLLVDRYAHDHAMTPDWVGEALQTYSSTFKFEDLTWSAQRAFERGSFATLLGLAIGHNETDLEVLCIGDSLALHVRAGTVLASFPFDRPEQFDARPTLLSTKGHANFLWANSEFFLDASRTWIVEPGDVIYAVTDAVGHWILSHLSDDKIIPQSLDAATSEADFTTLVEELRRTRHMRLDDSTVLRLIVENG
jgi:hypothetical protein